MTLWMDVDTALSEAPVNILSLIDDTDFKSREDSIVYNAAGMDLVFNFVTTSGVFTQTAVTPTTAGNYDWINQGDGMYTIEIPASGGASINNDTEGYGWFTGFVTGVLPWRGPIIGFRAVALNNALIDGGDNLDVNTVQWLGTAVTLSANNNPDINVDELSDDLVAPQNLELQYDTTGLTGDTFPATQLQLSQIAAVGAAVNTPSESYLLTTGTQSSGTFADTSALDGVHHQHTDTGGVLELYYQFDIGGDGVPTAITVTGRINGSNDTLDGVYAYNWGTTTWDRIGDFVGQTSTTNVVRSYDLFTSHVGTGANLGKVRIRFYAASGLTTSELFIDQIFTSYAVVARSVGYANGAIWIDTNGSNTNTASYVDGVADNPVSTWAAALTLSGNLNIVRFQIVNGSSITLSGNSDNYTIMGENWALALGGQAIDGIFVSGADVSGTGTNGSNEPEFVNCHFGAITLPASHLNRCGFSSTLTLGSAGMFFLDNCHSAVSGISTPVIEMGAGIGATDINIRSWSGGLTFNNILAGDIISLEGLGGVITINGTGGEIHIRGIFQGVVDNTSDAVAITETATLNRQSLAGYAHGAIWVDTLNGTAGTRDYVNGTQINPVDNLTDAYTLMTSVGLSRLQIEQKSALTLPSDSSYKRFMGDAYTVDLNGQNIEGSTFQGSFLVSGIGTGGTLTDPPTFLLSAIGTVTLPPCNGFEIGFAGTFTMSSVGVFTFGSAGATGGTTPIFDFGSGLNASSLYLPDWTNGTAEIQNAGAGTGTYIFELSGRGGLSINSNCSDTTNVILRGHIDLTNNSAITSIVEEVNYSSINVNTEVLDVITVDTFAEPSSVPAATSTIEDKLSWLFTLSRNKGTQTNTTKTLRDDADSADIATAAVSDIAGVFTRDEFS